MKIALVAFHFAEYAYRLASVLAKDNEVLLMMHRDNALQELGEAVLEAQSAKLRIALFRKRGPKDPFLIVNVLKIIRLLKQFSPDVIHCQESLNYALTIALRFLRRVPFVLTIHDHIPHSGTKEPGHAKPHRAYLRQIPDAVIVHGERIRVESEELFPWLKSRITSIPHGPLGDTETSADSEWEVGTVLFFGRIEKYKGLSYLMEAASILKKKGVAVKVIIAGRGKDLASHRETIRNNRSFELIERFIEKEETRELFERANVVVLPYTEATQSGIVALAIQYGRPVVATDVGSIGEVVRNGFNGLLVPPRDADMLAEAIESLIMDQDLAKKMGRNAKELARTDVSWDAIAPKTIKTYHRALLHKQETNKRNVND
jgi:alpha-maltose-1-phosphate synthase